MELSIGGTPATAEQLENLRNAMGVPSKAELLARDPVVSAGMAKVMIDGAYYAMLPLDANGDIVANITHRTGLLADLLTADGGNGEIAFPSDAEGYVLYNGVQGQAKFVKRLDNAAALGPNSTAIGLNSGTLVGAKDSLALGSNVTAVSPGQVIYGSACPGINRSVVMGKRKTTNATAVSAYPDGVGVGGGWGLPSGKVDLHQITVTFLAREDWTNNVARFVRQILLAVDPEDAVSVTVLNSVTPVADFFSGLTGCSVSLLTGSGPSIAPRVAGLADRTITWLVMAEIVTLGEEAVL